VAENLSMTADYWAIGLKDEVREIDEDIILRDEAGCITEVNVGGEPWINPGNDRYCSTILSRVNRDTGGRIVAIERGPINIARKDVRGIDISAQYYLDAGEWGSFQAELNYMNLQSVREQIYRTDPNPNRRDRDVRSKVRGSISWRKGAWSATLFGDRVGSVPGVRYHWGVDSLDNQGGCIPFPDGGVPDARADCRDTDPNSPTFGQSTSKYYGRVGPAITWNVSVGYKVTDNASLAFYANNLFNSAGWNHKDPYKLGYEFYSSRLFSPVGRELALEYVLRFD
jgi:outer membrane receptor protein involved in Fe transport